MVKILCDRCGADISASKKIGYIAWNFREGLGGELMQENAFENSHYCPGCMEKIGSYIREKCTVSEEIVSKEPENAQKPVEMGQKAEEKPKQRRAIDYGKIMALRDAGWSNEKIADEMHMTKSSVATAISTYKKKHSGGGNP